MDLIVAGVKYRVMAVKRIHILHRRDRRAFYYYLFIYLFIYLFTLIFRWVIWYLRKSSSAYATYIAVLMNDPFYAWTFVMDF